MNYDPTGVGQWGFPFMARPSPFLLLRPLAISAFTSFTDGGYPPLASIRPTHPQQSPPQSEERGSAGTLRARPHISQTSSIMIVDLPLRHQHPRMVDMRLDAPAMLFCF
jgi:hypothetical protein